MKIWPFPPRDGMIESLEWMTDVLRAKSAEQRIAMRIAPRRSFIMEHVRYDYDYSAARTLVRDAMGGTGFLVPDWGQSTRIGAVASGASVAVSADLSSVDMGDTALLWESVSKYEQVGITIDSSGVTLDTVANTYTDARLLPLWAAHMPDGLGAQRVGARINQLSVAFQVYENTDLGASTYAQYRGHDIVPSCPVLGDGTLDDSLSWPLSAFDNMTGIPDYLRQRSIPDMQFTMRWHETTRADIYALRQWIHSRRGKQKAFWLSSRGNDFEPAASISGTTVKVFAVDGLIDRAVPFDIDVTGTNGTSYYRRVTLLSAGTPVGGRSTINMTIDSALSVALANIKRISEFRCARFDADRIELQHMAVAGVSVSVPCIEIPVP